MLTIRFARVGKKNRPHFKIMLQEHTIAPGGTHVEVLGSYDPHSKQAVLKEERIKYWISQGVKISDTAYNLFLKQGVITGEKRKVKIPDRKAEPSEADGPAKKAEEAPVEVVAEAKPEDMKDEVVETPKAEVSAPATETKEEKKPKKETSKSEEKKPKEKEMPKSEEKKPARNAADGAEGGEEAKTKETKAQ